MPHVQELAANGATYDIDHDADERINIYKQLSAAARAQLHAAVTALSTCHGPSSCWAAGWPR